MPRGEVHQSWGMLQDAPSKASMTCPGTLRAGSPSSGAHRAPSKARWLLWETLPSPTLGWWCPLHRFLLPSRMCLTPFCERRLETLPPSPLKSRFAIHRFRFNRNLFKYSNLSPFYPPITRFALFILMFYDEYDESEYSPEFMSHTKRPSVYKQREWCHQEFNNWFWHFDITILTGTLHEPESNSVF